MQVSCEMDPQVSLPSDDGGGPRVYPFDVTKIVCVDEEKIQKYVKWQQKKDKEEDSSQQQSLFPSK